MVPDRALEHGEPGLDLVQHIGHRGWGLKGDRYLVINVR
jgi:hypothetical protein